MYKIGRKPTKSEAFVRVICHIVVKDRGLSIEPLSESEIEALRMVRCGGIRKSVMSDFDRWQLGGFECFSGVVDGKRG